MPTYEYVCRSCGEHLEVVQSFRDEPLTTCPACGSALRKVFGSIGVVFKGSGFYKTDSRPAAKESSSKESSTTTASDSAASSGTAKDGAGAKDSKTADRSSGSGSSDKGSPKKEASSSEKTGTSPKESGKSAAAS